MTIFAIDPGPTTSGVVWYDTEARRVVTSYGEMPNEVALSSVRDGDFDLLGCESIEAMYAHVGKETIRTIRFTGRIEEAGHTIGKPACLLSPQEVKKHVCKTAAAKDPAVRQALIDIFGGESATKGRKTCDKCNGKTHINIRIRCVECDETGIVSGVKPGTTKKCPKCKGRTDIAATSACGCDGKMGEQGALYGVSDHAWRALAVAYAVSLIINPEA